MSHHLLCTRRIFMAEVANTNYAKICELCNIAEAVLYCPSDSAFLCYICDANVHSANFLVARHLRYALHLPRPAHSHNSSSSSTCTQSSTSQKKIDYLDRHRHIGQVMISSTSKPISQTRSKILKTGESVFQHWCNKLGLMYYSDEESLDVVRRARDALAVCLDRLRGCWTPAFRVCLAACLWFSLRLRTTTSSSTRLSVRSVEQISGVPAKLILATELKLQRLVKANKPRHPQVLEEGWDETSP